MYRYGRYIFIYLLESLEHFLLFIKIGYCWTLCFMLDIHKDVYIYLYQWKRILFAIFNIFGLVYLFIYMFAIAGQTIGWIKSLIFLLREPWVISLHIFKVFLKPEQFWVLQPERRNCMYVVYIGLFTKDETFLRFGRGKKKRHCNSAA